MNKDNYLEHTFSLENMMVSQNAFQISCATRMQKLKNSNIEDDFINTLQRDAQARKEKLDKLKENVSKLENILPPETYRKLRSSIENEWGLAAMLETDCQNFLDTNDTKYSDSILYSLELENEYSNSMLSALQESQLEFSFLICNDALNDRLSIEDIRDIASRQEVNSPLRKNLETLADTLERRKALEPVEPEKTNEVEEGSLENESTLESVSEQEETIHNQEENQEERSSSENADNALETSDVVEHEMTLQEKIEQINFKNQGNISKEVQNITIEDRLGQISKELEELHNKEKLSLGDFIHLHGLEEEKLGLENYQKNLDHQKLSKADRRRDASIVSYDKKIELQNAQLNQSRENYEQYQSKIMRFFSARYQEQLEVDIQKLREKRGIVEQNQRISALAKYDTISGHIVSRAHRKGFTQGLKSYTSVKLSELKAFRDQVVGELNAIQSDMDIRFQSRMDELPALQSQTVVMPDNIISLDEYRQSQEQHLAA